MRICHMRESIRTKEQLINELQNEAMKKKKSTAGLEEELAKLQDEFNIQMEHWTEHMGDSSHQLAAKDQIIATKTGENDKLTGELQNILKAVAFLALAPFFRV